MFPVANYRPLLHFISQIYNGAWYIVGAQHDLKNNQKDQKLFTLQSEDYPLDVLQKVQVH